MSLRKGSDFKDVNLFKILHEGLTHHGYTYKEGLNVLDGKFRPQGDCEPGGLYVTAYPERWLQFGTLIAPVTLQDDAQVWEVATVTRFCVEPTVEKIKVDKLILGKWSEISDDLYMLSLRQLIINLSGIPFHRRTLPICTVAIQHCATLLDVPENLQTDEMFLFAVQQNGYNLKDVPEEKRSLSLCRIAVLQHADYIHHVPAQHRKMVICITAVEQKAWWVLACVSIGVILILRFPNLVDVNFFKRWIQYM